ncbi:MAG: class F420-dependent oxidoreductase [Frondihabitans sp.]|nr:class F420-dependent oxidoreductase [Frondihabitans sp.]
MPERSVRVGVQIAPQHSSYSTIRDTLAELEDLGVDIAFNWDHFYPLSGDPDGTHFEGWSMLAAWAEQTHRIEFGPLVTCNSYRNPDLLADMARTVDHISAKGGTGRLILGIGSGWFQRDYEEFGYEFGTAGSRLDALSADLPRIEARLGKGNPSPTRHIPVLIGGGGEKKTLRIVAQHADIWHSFSDTATLAHKLEVLASWCDEVGRSVDDIEISTGVDREVKELTAEQGEVLDAQYALGARLFTVGITGPEIDLTPVRALLAWRDQANG